MTQDLPLSGVDAAWLRMEEPTNLMVVNALMRFDDPITLEGLRGVLTERLLPFPRFTSVIHQPLLGRPVWRSDPNFRLDAHVQHIALPEPGDASLSALVSNLASQPLDETKPLWRFYLIENVDDAGSNAMFVRIHHSVADGFSLLYLVLALADPGTEILFPAGITAPKLSAQEAGEVSEIVETIERKRRLPTPGELRSLFSVQDLGRWARHAGSAPSAATRLLMLPNEHRTSLRGRLGTQKHVTWTEPIDLPDIKRVAAQWGGTVNDVLMLTLTGALRRYLYDRNESLRDLRITMPVNLLPLEHRTRELGNGFGLVFLDLPVGEENTRARLEALKRRLGALKRSPDAYVTYALLSALGLAPATLQAQFLKLFQRKVTAIATNVPGPLGPIRFAGKDISDIVFWVPQSADVGLGMSIFSYCGKVRVGISADAERMPDINGFRRAFQSAFLELLEEG